MSAKEKFLQKLKAQRPRSGEYKNRGLADIAEFRQRMGLLHAEMESWLRETGIGIASVPVSLTELLVGAEAFSVPGIMLRFDKRMMKFTPVFLYGQGVTGCVEVTVCIDGNATPLCRLFMRSSNDVNWTWKPAGTVTSDSQFFDEDAFFTLLEYLLPSATF